jgi:imidazolonepropionase-like amidohydrolase
MSGLLKHALLVVTIACCLNAGLIGAPADKKITIIRDARVYTMGPAGVLPRATIVIIDNKIAGVGPSVKALSIGSSYPIIDGRGLEVYPGLINAWSNIGLTEITAVPATNDAMEMGDFNPHLLAFSAVHPASEHIPVARVNGITTSLTVPSGGIISGQAALLHLDGWTTDEMTILKSAGMVINFPALSGRGGSGGGFNPGLRRETFAEAKRNFERRLKELSELLEEARHYDKARGANPATERDRRLEALIPVVQGRQTVFLRADAAADIRNAVEFAKREKLKAVIQGGQEANKVADILRKENIPVILDSIVRLPAREDDPYDRPFTVPRDLAKSGVRFALTSPSSADVRNLPYEAGFAEAYGLAHEEALRAITTSPAEILGVADSLGTIEAGKLADLVITDGDILELRTQIKHLFIAGKNVALDSKHSRLYQKYLARQ